MHINKIIQCQNLQKKLPGILQDLNQSSCSGKQKVECTTWFICRIREQNQHQTINRLEWFSLSSQCSRTVARLLTEQWLSYWLNSGSVTDWTVARLLTEQWLGYWLNSGSVTDWTVAWLLTEQWLGYWLNSGSVTDWTVAWLLTEWVQ